MKRQAIQLGRPSAGGLYASVCHGNHEYAPVVGPNSSLSLLHVIVIVSFHRSVGEKTRKV